MRSRGNSAIVAAQSRICNLPVYESPEDAEMAFYVAIENRDVDAMMDVWSGSDDVVCIHPGAPRLEGREIIADSWQQIFSTGESLRFRLTDHASAEPDFEDDIDDTFDSLDDSPPDGSITLH